MPTYEYKCDACGFEFEKFQSITAKPIRKCPHCGKNKVQRKIGTGAGLIFKGGGFYITDYRSEAYKNAAKSESGSTAATGESKPAASGDNKKPSESPKPAEKAKSAETTTSKPASGKSSKPAK